MFGQTSHPQLLSGKWARVEPAFITSDCREGAEFLDRGDGEELRPHHRRAGSAKQDCLGEVGKVVGGASMIICITSRYAWEVSSTMARRI